MSSMCFFRKLSDDSLRALVAESSTYAELSRAVGQKISGSSKAYLDSRILALGLDKSHFVKKKADKLDATSDADFAAHVCRSRSWRELARLCGYAVKTYGYQQREHLRARLLGRAQRLAIDAAHLFVSGRRSAPAESVFVRNSSADRSQVKRRLLRDLGWPYKCRACNNLMFEDRGGTPFWFDQPVTLQLEHRNGISTDNRLENLELLCPLCHSQTSTYCGRNSLAARAKRARELARGSRAADASEGGSE